MAGIGSSTSQRLEEDTSHLTATDRVTAQRARMAHQREMVQAVHDAGFALGEDAPQNEAGRALQEARWAAANVDARTHFSVRELLQVQKPAVINALGDFDRVMTLVDAIGHQAAADDESPHQIARLTPELLELVVNSAMPGQARLVPALLSPTLRTLATPNALSTFQIFVRVRPLLEAETSSGEYAALDAPSNAMLVVHDARLARSGRRLAMIHHWYAADRIFGPHTSESGVCDGVLEPLLARVLDGAGDGTALLYGQTGAGKTYTMTSLLERVAKQLDSSAAGGGGGGGGGSGAAATAPAPDGLAEEPSGVEVSFFEVASKGCMDLLNARAKVQLRSDENDDVHACGATTCIVTSGEELRATLAQGLALRSTVETQANPISSRSHAICVLTVRRTGRTLRIVDLAGSERNYETHYEKTRDFQRESAAINKSLMALKDCFREAARAREQRARAAGGLPYSDALRKAKGAAAGWARMRASQEAAEGSGQHIDLTPKANQPKWTSSWRKGKVNGKAVGADPCPAIDVADAQSVPIEIRNLNTGEMIYEGEVEHASGPEAEEAAALAAAMRASLESAPKSAAAVQAVEETAAEMAAEMAAPIDAKDAATDGRAHTFVARLVAGVDAAADGGKGATASGEAVAPKPACAGAANAPVRVPYRANMLTRVLRNCFEDDTHRTAIVAAVAPGAESVIHTLNTLDHVVLMAPYLRHASCEVDVPMLGAAGQRHTYEDTPVHEWSAEQVIEWLASVDGGRFAQVVIPKGTDGKDLLRLNARRLTELVETENAEGRADGEGWYVSQQARVGRALFAALRDAQRKNGIRRRE